MQQVDVPQDNFSNDISGTLQTCVMTPHLTAEARSEWSADGVECENMTQFHSSLACNTLDLVLELKPDILGFALSNLQNSDEYLKAKVLKQNMF